MTENTTPGAEAEVITELTPEQEDVLEALRDVVDPELGINVVDLGLVYGVDVDAERVATIDMTLTSAACPLTDVIEDQARDALDGVVTDFRINWVWMPPWARRTSPRTGASSSAPSASISEPRPALKRPSDLTPPECRSGYRGG